jgi:ABC-type branched-subunit amino acid transport system substrate-binding protein
MSRTFTGWRASSVVGALCVVALAAGALPAGARTTSAASSCTVKIGVIYTSGAAAAGNAVGGSNLVSPDVQKWQDEVQVAFDDINKQGGIGGCTAVPVHATASATAPDYAADGQRVCAELTQDTKVFAVFGNMVPNDASTPCLVKAGVPVVLAAAFPPQDYSKYPSLLYNIAGIAPERMGQLLDVWKSQGELKKGSKAAIIWVDDAQGVQRKIVNDVWKPQLKKMGVTAEDVSLPQVTGQTAIAGSVSAMTAAVLKFKNDGVTQVLVTDAIPGFLFPQAAAAQGYLPHFLVSDVGPGPRQVANYASPEFAAGVRSIGWHRLDWDASTVPNTAVKPNSASKHCDKIYANFALPPLSTGGPGLPPYNVCDGVSFLRAALGDTKPTVKNLEAGVDKLGTSWVSALEIGPVRFAKGQHDGVMTVQNWTINGDTKATVPGTVVTLKGAPASG